MKWNCYLKLGKILFLTTVKCLVSMNQKEQKSYFSFYSLTCFSCCSSLLRLLNSYLMIERSVTSPKQFLLTQIIILWHKVWDTSAIAHILGHTANIWLWFDKQNHSSSEFLTKRLRRKPENAVEFSCFVTTFLWWIMVLKKSQSLKKQINNLKSESLFY